MKCAPLPPLEDARLETLRRLDVLDTGPEVRFDRVTALTRDVLKVPIALVSLVDHDRQWFKSRQGLEATETPRDVAFCAHAILRPEPLVVPDAREDPRFFDNPLVTGPPHIRFYAGCPLLVRGYPVGTLCAIDLEPRLLSQSDLKMLCSLASIVSDELERGDGAWVDATTGLLNERGFLEHADGALRRASRRGQRVSLLRLEVSASAAGLDVVELLPRLGAIVEATLAEADVVARLAGGSFALLFVGDGCESMTTVEEALERRIVDLGARLSTQVGRASCYPRGAGQLAVTSLLEVAGANLVPVLSAHPEVVCGLELGDCAASAPPAE